MHTLKTEYSKSLNDALLPSQDIFQVYSWLTSWNISMVWPCSLPHISFGSEWGKLVWKSETWPIFATSVSIWNSNQMTRRGQQCSTLKLTHTSSSLACSILFNTPSFILLKLHPQHNSTLFFQVKQSHVNLLTADCQKLFSFNIFSTSSLNWFKTCGLLSGIQISRNYKCRKVFWNETNIKTVLSQV